MWHLRLIFGFGDRLAPGRTARVAGGLWLTPPRRPDRRPDGLPAGGTDFAIDIGATTVRGTTWGDSGPWVYFVHGWGGRGDDVAPLVTAVVERGFRVATFDGPAHGRSRTGRPPPMSGSGLRPPW